MLPARWRVSGGQFADGGHPPSQKSKPPATDSIWRHTA
jgi:hypothetical protein